MYMLNLFWFFKMLWGFFKGLGIDKAIEDTMRVPEIGSDDDTDDSDDVQ